MRAIIILLLLIVSHDVTAGKDVATASVNYVYQPDLDPTQFEFNADVPNGCGSTLYRVVSNSETIANRKFAIILAAFSSGKK